MVLLERIHSEFLSDNITKMRSKLSVLATLNERQTTANTRLKLSLKIEISLGNFSHKQDKKLCQLLSYNIFHIKFRDINLDTGNEIRNQSKVKKKLTLIQSFHEKAFKTHLM